MFNVGVLVKAGLIIGGCASVPLTKSSLFTGGGELALLELLQHK